ncbi:hypothetical protein SK128_020024 [Halocaridina rubra]|uniref:SHSP domain-containing protein n=1 Tax=Halocaridina rubra TaxID=373956 RepID=A0AAN8WTS4_HALRR
MAPVHSERLASFAYSTHEKKNKREVSNEYRERFAPTASRGSSLSDSVFEIAMSRFDTEVTNMLSDWEEPDVFADDWSSFASSRHTDYFRSGGSRIQTLENHDFHATTEDGHVKINVDVSSIKAEEINVRVVGEREVDVEFIIKVDRFKHLAGKANRYRITFPSAANLDEASSDLSPEGVLTISAPLKVSQGVKGKGISIETKAYSQSEKSLTSGSQIAPPCLVQSEDKSCESQMYICEQCRQYVDSKEMHSLKENLIHPNPESRGVQSEQREEQHNEQATTDARSYSDTAQWS